MFSPKVLDREEYHRVHTREEMESFWVISKDINMDVFNRKRC